MTQPFAVHAPSTNKHRWWLISLVGVCVLFLIALVFASNRSAESAAPTDYPDYSNVKYPQGYRTAFHIYATVQRPDGTIRDIYINDVGVQGLRTGGIPSGTIIAIEGFNALVEENGKYVTDELGRYVKGSALPMIHVREKRANWAPTDFVSNARNGLWNSASFDFQSGELFEESLSACFHCHNTAPDDFLYTLPLLQAYAETEQQQFLACTTTGRTACE